MPVITLPARFGHPRRRAGVALHASLMLWPSRSASTSTSSTTSPEHFLFPLAAIVAVALLSTALLRSDLEHRSEAVVDPLTGMLNRNALITRVAELAQQAAVSTRSRSR